MSNLDPLDVQQQLYRLADAAGDGQVGAAQVQALLARMQGGGQVDASGAPTAASFTAPEALPYEAPEPASLEELAKRLPQIDALVHGVLGQAPTEGNWHAQAAAEESLQSYVTQLNDSLDRAAELNRTGKAPTPPATVEELLERAQGYAADPRTMTEDDALALAQEYNDAATQHVTEVTARQDADRKAALEKLHQAGKQRRRAGDRATAGR